jgi:hypothetical protein
MVFATPRKTIVASNVKVHNEMYTIMLSGGVDYLLEIMKSLSLISVSLKRMTEHKFLKA